MYLIFVSSLNENVKLAKLIKKEIENNDKEAKIINLVELELPLYDTHKQEYDGIPSQVLEISDMMEKASGYVFVTPEYNYSIPPVLTNFVAWLSRSSEDFRKVFIEKFIQLATHSGANGTDVLNAMRIQFTKLGAFVMPREIETTYTKSFDEHSDIKTIKRFLDFCK